jgi:hypothetical protein
MPESRMHETLDLAVHALRGVWQACTGVSFTLGGAHAPTMKYPLSLSVLLSVHTMMPYCGHSVDAVCPSSCNVKQAQMAEYGAGQGGSNLTHA